MIAVNRQIDSPSAHVSLKPFEASPETTIGAEQHKASLTAEEFVELVEKSRQELVRRSARLLWSMGVPNARNEAEELMSVFVVKMLGRLDKYDPTWPFMGFAWTSMRHLCISFAKRNRLEKSRINGKFACDEIAADGSSAVDRSEAVRKALDDLPPAEREIVSMRIHVQLSFRTIAVMLGMSTAKAKRRYETTLAKLARLLAESCGDFGR